MTSAGSDDSSRKRTGYYPWWLDNLADDVTGEGAAIEGTLHGAEDVRKLVLDARELYEQQDFHFTGDYGDKGFIEEYTCLIQGAPTSAVVTVTRNAAGKAQHLVVNHRPRSSVLLFARVMARTAPVPPRKVLHRHRSRHKRRGLNWRQVRNGNANREHGPTSGRVMRGRVQRFASPVSFGELTVGFGDCFGGRK